MAQFKRGRASCEDKHHRDRPNEVTTSEMVKKIHKMILDHRRLKVLELTDTVGISKRAVYRTLSENLGTKKLCGRWVSRLLRMEQKQREDVSIECLTVFRRNEAEFLLWFITVYETWIRHFTPEMK